MLLMTVSFCLTVSFFSLDHCVTVLGQKLRRKKGTAGDNRYGVTGTAFCLIIQTHSSAKTGCICVCRLD